MKSVKEESDRLGHEMCVLVAKLEVAISENMLKDEFIVKFITAKNTSEGHNSRWVEEILKEYLKTCQYPRNGLLLKLREEEGEIYRLQMLLAERK